MPKLPPPPRIAQKRSGLESADAVGLAVGGDHLRRDQVVAREAVLAPHPSVAAAQREAGYAGVGDHAAGATSPKRLGLAVDVAPERAALDVRQPPLGVDLHARIGARSISMPPSIADRPAIEWPPPRTATASRWSRAKLTASTTSAVPEQRATSRTPGVHRVEHLAHLREPGSAAASTGPLKGMPRAARASSAIPVSPRRRSQRGWP